MALCPPARGSSLRDNTRRWARRPTSQAICGTKACWSSTGPQCPALGSFTWLPLLPNGQTHISPWPQGPSSGGDTFTSRSATQGPRQPFLSPSKPPATLPTTLLSITVSLQEFKPCAPFLQGLSSSPGHIQPVAEAARSVCIAGLITPFLSLRGFQQCLSTLNHGLQTSGTLTHRKNFILPLILQCTYFCN